jgi:general secretion pathway protein D
MSSPPITFLSILLAAVLLGCSTTAPELRHGRELAAQGRLEDAVRSLEAGAARDPQDRELRIELARQRDVALALWMSQADAALQARDHDGARTLYDKALRLEPSNARARAGIAAIEAMRHIDERVARAEQLAARHEVAQAEALLRDALAQQPSHAGARRLLARLRQQQQSAPAAAPSLKGALAKPITLELRETPLRNAFDVIARAAPLNFVFDREVRGDARVSINVRASPVDDVIRLLLATQQLDSKVLNDNSLLIYPDTPAKQREYRELTTRMFYLVNADAKQAQALLKTVGKIKEVHVDERLNLLAIRDTADAVRLAEKLIAAVDLAEPEVMLEVEVLEITRTRLRDLGIRFPTEIQIESKLPLPANVPAGRIDLNRLQPSSLAATILNPALRIGLQSTDTDVNLLANPRIRAKNREKARILIGEKLPVFTTTAVQNAGVSASVSYLDVGLKLEVEANVFLDDEVAIKVLLEVTSNLERVAGPDGSAAFRLGTRTAQTTLRLRDGETQVLAGLINDSERETLAKLPGLGDLPGVGRAFGNTNRSHDKTEIVLLITPRVLRNLALPDADSIVVAAGTEASSGARPLTIAATPARGLAIPAASTPGSARPAAPSPAASVPADAAPAAPAAPPAVSLRGPGEVSIGREFTLDVRVDQAGDAAGGEVVLQFDASLLQAAGAAGGRVVVPLARVGDAQLGGSIGFRAAAAGTGSTVVRLAEGRLRLPDGSLRPLPTAAVTVRIGL